MEVVKVARGMVRVIGRMLRCWRATRRNDIIDDLVREAGLCFPMD